MKRSILFIAVMLPLCLCADANAPLPLDTWELVEGLTLAFARSISGRPVHYAWSGVTDEAGRVDLDIVTLDW